MTLDEIALGEEVIVQRICCEDCIHRRLLDLGILEQSKIQPVLSSPSHDMRAYLVKGCVIALRKRESSSILVKREGEELV